jgi:hypothetical protein
MFNRTRQSAAECDPVIHDVNTGGSAIDSAEAALTSTVANQSSLVPGV